jgi:8-oxo-dGTP pyrophosphatase MutT (NUDIX family)
MSYLDHIKSCNNFTLQGKVEFLIDGERVGYIRKEYMPYLLDSGVFVKESEALSIAPQYTTMQERNSALDLFAKNAFRDGITNIYMNEPYPVLTNINSDPLCLVDRSVSTLLGLISFGQHLNGYVKSDDGLKMWIARRSFTRGYEAGKLDHIAAGGLPYGISLRENLQKECYEEAGMDKELSGKAICIGVVSYRHEYTLGGKEDLIYCYDLELPKDFAPHCTDGEVEEFYLMDIEEVANIVKTTNEFKLNCNLVIIDFLIRHGLLDESDKEYIDIVRGLRV